MRLASVTGALFLLAGVAMGTAANASNAVAAKVDNDSTASGTGTPLGSHTLTSEAYVGSGTCVESSVSAPVAIVLVACPAITDSSVPPTGAGAENSVAGIWSDLPGDRMTARSITF